MPFPSEEDLKRKFCPLLRDRCRGADCAMLRWGSHVDPRTNKRAAFCGVAGQKGSYLIAPSRGQQAQAAIAEQPLETI